MLCFALIPLISLLSLRNSEKQQTLVYTRPTLTTAQRNQANDGEQENGVAAPSVKPQQDAQLPAVQPADMPLFHYPEALQTQLSGQQTEQCLAYHIPVAETSACYETNTRLTEFVQQRPRSVSQLSPLTFWYSRFLFGAQNIAEPVTKPLPQTVRPTAQPGIVQVAAFNHTLLPTRYFAQTGHNVGGSFLDYYETHGGLVVFGLPLTEVLQEAGVQVQYFERVRLERPVDQPTHVSIAPLGALLTHERHDEPSFRFHPPAQTTTITHAATLPLPADLHLTDTVYFTRTGHHMRYQHYRYWQQHGGEAVFGLPISEPLIEQNRQTGRSYMVQYFERTRFEYHLGRPDEAYHIQHGLLGREYLVRQDMAEELLQPAQPVKLLGQSQFHFAPVPVAMINVGLAAREFNSMTVMPGQEVSFLDTVGNLSAETGYTWGGAIVNGSVQKVIAGGVCYLSTAVYQAVLDAGLDVIERHQHSILLEDFSHPPGMDSAVFMYDASGQSRSNADLDLVWRNDMDEPVMLTVNLSASGELTISFWGHGDGRTTTLHEPQIQYTDQPGGPLWVYDETLDPCEVKQVSSQAPGMSVTVARTVHQENGDILHNDTFVSYYGPSRDVFTHGAGITQTGDIALVQNACRSAPRPAYHAAQHDNPPDQPQDVGGIPPSAGDDTHGGVAADEDAALPTSQPHDTLVTMPALYGKTHAEATAILQNMGFAAEQIYLDNQQLDDCVPSTVVSTVPPGNQEFDPVNPIILGVCAAEEVAEEPTPLPQPAPGSGTGEADEPVEPTLSPTIEPPAEEQEQQPAASSAEATPPPTLAPVEEQPAATPTNAEQTQPPAQEQGEEMQDEPATPAPFVTRIPETNPKATPETNPF